MRVGIETWFLTLWVINVVGTLKFEFSALHRRELYNFDLYKEMIANRMYMK